MRTVIHNQKYIKALEKIAYPFGMQQNMTVGVSYPPPSVSDVLNAIGQAQVHNIGTPQQRQDAFGRIINSGLVDTSPASDAIRMIGGGLLGRAITGLFTKNPIYRGIGAGVGALTSLSRH